MAPLLPLIAFFSALLGTPPPQTATPDPGVNLRGYNLLQKQGTPFSAPQTGESLRRAQATGANSVAVVFFLHQSAPDSPQIEASDAVSDADLLAAVRQARALGLKVIIKPIVLVDGSWAGAIRPRDDDARRLWFTQYQALLLKLADLAQREDAQALVLGNELSGLADAPEWPGVIANVRQRFLGKLTFAANGVEGVAAFPYWSLLDAVAVDLYPNLGTSSSIRERVDATLAELRAQTRDLKKPIWVLEVGMPSAQGFLERPWDWAALSAGATLPDSETQAAVLSAWLDAALTNEDWVHALLIWCWFSAPDAGGAKDIDYTVQNKLAQNQVQCRWTGRC